MDEFEITNGPITADKVKEAEAIREKYKDGKASLDLRIVENEQYWKMLHWQQNEQKEDEKKVKRDKVTSAWLFNSIANKHADAMDNYPELNVLPREESDRVTAKALSSILPCIFENANFEQTYNDCWWNKLKSGTAVYGVFWNNGLEEGLGDVDIQKIDILNVFWEPGIMDIQKSRNLFIVEMIDADLVKDLYGVDVKGTGEGSKVVTYTHNDYLDTSGKVAVVDWYYKKQIEVNDESGIAKTKTILHYVKYCDGHVLFASENNEEYQEKGWYWHGKYPVIFDTMFQEEGYPAGFGYIDIMKNPQRYIDKLGDNIMRSSLWGSSPRYFANRNIGINLEQFADPEEAIVEVDGNFDDSKLRPITIPPLDPNYIGVMNNKIEELKETSGNRDFSQGGTAAGVTAGSAIAALMEAGSKLSRDTIKASYRVHQEIGKLVIELMRQFYTEPRNFRITAPNEEFEFVTYDNSQIQEQPIQVEGVTIGTRRPVFDLRCVSQKASPFAKLSQNELAKELYSMGFFNPELTDQAMVALEMMEFDGKDMVQQKISQNGMLFQKVQELSMQLQQVMGILGQQMEIEAAGKTPGTTETNSESNMGDINTLGAEVGTHEASERAKEEAANQAAVR
jgi:hypothetical protein